MFNVQIYYCYFKNICKNHDCFKNLLNNFCWDVLNRILVSIHALEHSRELYKVPRTSGAVEGTLQGT